MMNNLRIVKEKMGQPVSIVRVEQIHVSNYVGLEQVGKK